MYLRSAQHICIRVTEAGWSGLGLSLSFSLSPLVLPLTLARSPLVFLIKKNPISSHGDSIVEGPGEWVSDRDREGRVGMYVRSFLARPAPTRE